MQDITNCILRQMNSTRLISTLFKPRQKATALYATQAEALQHKVFCRLMKDAAHTEWGLKYGYKDIKRYQDFQRVPIQTYEEIKPYVERMRHGEKDVLWRGEVQWFAKEIEEKIRDKYNEAFEKSLGEETVDEEQETEPEE